LKENGRKTEKQEKGKKEKKNKNPRKGGERREGDKLKTKKDGILDLEGPSLRHTSPFKLKFKALPKILIN